MLHAWADGRIEDTGPLSSKRMETIDEEIHGHATRFIEEAVRQDTPFFVWFNTTRMHVWTHLKQETVGRTGIGLYPDGMVEHDDMVGQLLDRLEELGIADNTIVVYSTDNGAEEVSWPGGGTSPFHGEKGTSWEGGHRVPQLIRWPGVIQPGTRINQVMSHQDWLPTLLAAAGEPNIKEQLAEGHQAGDKTFRVHLDGYSFLPFLKGETDTGPREEYLYFSQGGELNAVRWNDWKVHFAVQRGNIATGTRDVTGWPTIVNLRADPFERGPNESGMYIRWYAENMWLFVPVQQKLQEFFKGFMEYPYQMGSSLNAANISYQTLRLAEAQHRLGKLEELPPPRN